MNDREYLQRVCQEPLKAWNNNHDWKGGDDDFIAWAIGPVHRSTDRWSACERAQADGAFISASRNEVPKMLAEIAELRAELSIVLKTIVWTKLTHKQPETSYADIGDELVVYRPGYGGLTFTAQWDAVEQLFYTGGFGAPRTYWHGITLWRPLPKPPEIDNE